MLKYLISKKFIEIERKAKPYKTGREIHTHSSQEIQMALKDLKRYLTLLIIRDENENTISHLSDWERSKNVSVGFCWQGC